MHLLSAAASCDNRSKIFRLEGGTANQAAVDVRLREQFCCVAGLHRTAVLDGQPLGNRFVVKQGLSVGDTIITEGVGQIKEGMIVTPKTVTP